MADTFPHFVWQWPIRNFRVVDGDTVEVAADIGSYTVRKYDVRLMNINAPEKTGKEKEGGRAVTEFVDYWFRQNHVGGPNQNYIVLRSYELDKYGRLLGDFMAINADGENTELALTDLLLHHNLVVPYDGGKRDAFKPKELKRIAEWVQNYLTEQMNLPDPESEE